MASDRSGRESEIALPAGASEARSSLFGVDWEWLLLVGVIAIISFLVVKHPDPYRRIVVFPYFLFTGVLVPRIYDDTDKAAARHPEIDFVKAQYLGDHPLVVDTFLERIIEALAGRPR